ncbi:MAG TPA: bacterial transcriptional activator domain-containing protein [Streptosporangiaceae bacterium]|nr:bacterial transcriptional activator domain-containing protein [Streptosporangiaceae bacterium]
MALSLVSLAIGAGHLAAASFPGRMPGVAVFGAGMLTGALTVALAGWFRPRSQDSGAGQPPAASDAAPAGAVEVRARQARPRRGAVASPVPAEPPPPAPSLRIGVLGSLTINGQAGALVPAQSQLIVALALNRDGLSNRKLRVLLGADSGHPKPADSLRQLIARTRRALGQAGDGREWIEHLGHGQYALHPDTRVDWREFETLTAEGISSAGAGPLTEALNMIRGQPFTGCYYWWLEPAMVDAVTARIVAAAETLAELSLAGRHPAAAVRAARIGLTADPSAEQLWRIMMRAEHAAGNLAGVREAWGRCLHVVSEVAADGQPDSATSAVYDELLAR